MINKDLQFWNFLDIAPDASGDLPRWKYSYPCTRELFIWEPWGSPGWYQERELQPLGVEKDVLILWEEVDQEEPVGTTFLGDMAYPP